LWDLIENNEKIDEIDEDEDDIITFDVDILIEIDEIDEIELTDEIDEVYILIIDDH